MWPELTYRYPTTVNGNISDLDVQIILDWSVDIDSTQFSNDESRANLFVLMDDTTSEVVGTDYVSYTTSTKRLILSPTDSLLSSRQYRIIVKPLVLSTDGRRSQNSYTWVFDTATSSVSVVSLLSPPDATVQTVFPTLSWNTVSGTGISYHLQIDDSPIFSSINYTVTTTGSSITPAGTFTDNTTYFWRVRAYTTTSTGAWSDVWSFFFGTSLQAHITSRQTWEDSDSFGVSSEGFTNGSSNLSAYPTISFTFTSAPATSFSSYLQVRRQSIRPRNDDVDTYAWYSVSGSWSQSGNTLTFTPSEAIATNTRYEIILSKNLINEDGTTLDEDLTYYFTGAYSPYYCDIRVIRSKFLSAELQIPDDLINYEIYNSSLEAHARYYGLGYGDTLIGDSLTEAMVRDTTKLRSFAVGKWVEAATYYTILRAILNETLRNIGRDRSLGNYKEGLSADFVKGIQLALDQAKDDIQQYEDMLAPSHVARGTERNIRWSPDFHLLDASIRDHEGRRHL